MITLPKNPMFDDFIVYTLNSGPLSFADLTQRLGDAGFDVEATKLSVRLWSLKDHHRIGWEDFEEKDGSQTVKSRMYFVPPESFETEKENERPFNLPVFLSVLILLSIVGWILLLGTMAK